MIEEDLIRRDLRLVLEGNGDGEAYADVLRGYVGEWRWLRGEYERVREGIEVGSVVTR